SEQSINLRQLRRFCGFGMAWCSSRLHVAEKTLPVGQLRHVHCGFDRAFREGVLYGGSGTRPLCFFGRHILTFPVLAGDHLTITMCLCRKRLAIHVASVLIMSTRTISTSVEAYALASPPGTFIARSKMCSASARPESSSDSGIRST